ncbi:YqzE family protein [Virgibacillus ainsalahensis]
MNTICIRISEGVRIISGNDYIKFITQQLVTYIDLPPTERKKRKAEKNKYPTYTNRWFGVLPFALRTIRKKAE